VLVKFIENPSTTPTHNTFFNLRVGLIFLVKQLHRFALGMKHLDAVTLNTHTLEELAETLKLFELGVTSLALDVILVRFASLAEPDTWFVFNLNAILVTSSCSDESVSFNTFLIKVKVKHTRLVSLVVSWDEDLGGNFGVCWRRGARDRHIER